MARRKLLRSRIFPYHVTARCNNKEWLFLNNKESWDIFIDELFSAVLLTDAKIFSFVLMANHFHLLLETPGANVDSVMQYLLTNVSKRLGLILERSGHIFERRYKWTLVTNNTYLSNVYRYICQNPVRANVTQLVEDYPFSSVQAVITPNHPMLDCLSLSSSHLSLIPRSPKDQLKWLNTALSKKENNAVKLGLRRSKFIPVE